VFILSYLTLAAAIGSNIIFQAQKIFVIDILLFHFTAK